MPCSPTATTYQGFAKGRSLAALAADHGVAPKVPSARNLTDVWFQPHEQYYAGTVLRHRRPATTEEYAGRDVLAELVEPCRKRGMKLCARILEGHGARLASTMDNWPKILTVDVYGRPNCPALLEQPGLPQLVAVHRRRPLQELPAGRLQVWRRT